MILHYSKSMLRFFPLPKKKDDLFCLYITSIAIGLLCTFYVYTLQSFELTSFSERIHGVGIFDGVDVFKRQPLYYMLLGTFFTIFTCMVSLFSNIMKQFSDNYQKDTILFEKYTLSSLASVLSFSVLLMLMNNSIYKLQYMVFKELTIAVACILVFRWLFVLWGKHNISEKIKLQPAAFGFFFIVGWVYLSSRVFQYSTSVAFNVKMAGTRHVIGLFFIGWILSVLDKKHVWLRCCAPILLLPLCIVGASEVQYMAMANGYPWSLKFILVCFGFLLCLLSGAIYYIKRQIPVNTNTLMKFWYFPVCIFILAVTSFYQSTKNIGGDLLHPGNAFSVAHQVIEFCKIPFVDIWPHRGFRDIFPSMFFMFFAGVKHAVDSFIWNFVSYIITYVFLLYIVFTRFFRSSYAFFLTILFFPVYDHQTIVYYAMLLFPVLFLPWVMKNLTFVRAGCVWFSSLLVFVWMPSAGKASVLSLWLVFVIQGIRNIRLLFCRVIPAFFTVFGGAGLAYIIFLFFRDINIFDRIKLISDFAGMDFSFAYTQIVSSPSVLAIWYYVILPIFFCSICVLFAWRKFSFQYITGVQWIYLGIAASMFFVVTRALGRHCLLEGCWDIFTFLLIALLPCIRPFKQRLFFPCWLLVTVAILLVIKGNFLILSPTALQIPFVNWKVGDLERVQYIGKDEPIVSFLKKELQEDETFLDLVNGHSLYAYTKKDNPYFLTMISLYLSDKGQKILLKDLQKCFDEDKMPLAIVNAQFWGSHIDNIDSTVRSYRIGEFIYENYEPFINIFGYEVWAAKNSRFVKSVIKNKAIKISVPIMREQVYVINDVSVTVDDHVLILKGGPQDPFVMNMLTAANIPPLDVTQYRCCLCELEITNTTEGLLQVFFSFDKGIYLEENSATIVIPKFSKKRKVQLVAMIPDDAQTLTDIRLDCPDNTTMKIYSLDISCTENPILPLTVNQYYIHKKGPYLWGNYDPYHAIDNPVVVTFLEDVTLKPYEEYKVSIPQYENKTIAEYLHFRVTAPQGGEIAGYIQDTNNHSGVFTFVLQESPEPVDYLVRVSTTYAWINKEQFTITSNSGGPVTIHSLEVLEGD